MPCSLCDFLERQVHVAARGLALLREERAFRRGAATLLGGPENNAFADIDQAIARAEVLLTRAYWTIEEHQRCCHADAPEEQPEKGSAAAA